MNEVKTPEQKIKIRIQGHKINSSLSGVEFMHDIPICDVAFARKEMKISAPLWRSQHQNRNNNPERYMKAHTANHRQVVLL